MTGQQSIQQAGSCQFFAFNKVEEGSNFVVIKITFNNSSLKKNNSSLCEFMACNSKGIQIIDIIKTKLPPFSFTDLCEHGFSVTLFLKIQNRLKLILNPVAFQQ